ncbi:hypothetical protein ACFX15_038748 [Malus domestica]
MSDVTYNGFHGTSATEEAIKFDCSENPGCANINLHQIKITSAIAGKEIRAFCTNLSSGTCNASNVHDVPCLHSWDKTNMHLTRY